MSAERVYIVTKDDLLGLIDFAARYSARIPRRIIANPKEPTRDGWRGWAETVLSRIEKRPLRRRLLPGCHELGSDPRGYDWEGDECDACAVKLLCILAGAKGGPPRSLELKIAPDVSEKAIRASVSPDRRKRARKRRVYERLVHPNPYANYTAGSIWDVYPNHFVIPKVHPHKVRPDEASPLLYRIEIHNNNDRPMLYVSDVYDARKAAERVAALNFGELETMLESMPHLWGDVHHPSSIVTDASALHASGSNAHVQRHVRVGRAIDIGVLPWGDVDTMIQRGLAWSFWNMYAPKREPVKTRHQYAKMKRREGVKRLIKPRRITKCLACERNDRRLHKKGGRGSEEGEPTSG